MSGSVAEACTRATICLDGVSVVIIHAAPTDWMTEPKFDTRMAIQIWRKAACRNGEKERERAMRRRSNPI
ncbi:hypothetical protein GCM10019060_35420 [Novosphingobium pokkalii]|nr:hypothetical protein GCM10019060_35420 [Novosphingobium pokkalii]